MSMNINMIQVAVCGAHMQGLPLNAQLSALGGVFVKQGSTSANYKLFKLNGFTPARPGLLRVNEHGTSIALEIWQLPIANYGQFVASVPAPLGFGTLTLIDNTTVQGFMCEAYATQNATDISHLGGWRAFLKAD